MTKSNFEAMTKAELVQYAQKEHGITLNMKMLKGDMITSLLNTKKKTARKTTTDGRREKAYRE